MLNERNESLWQRLLKERIERDEHPGERSQQVNSLLLNANDLIGVLRGAPLRHREPAGNTSALSKQLSGIVADNEKELATGPGEDQRGDGDAERNNDNITAAMKGLAKYQMTQAEAVNMVLYNAFVANLSPGQIAQPFFDYARSASAAASTPASRRTTRAAGRDPSPYNGIPQPHERWGEKP